MSSDFKTWAARGGSRICVQGLVRILARIASLQELPVDRGVINAVAGNVNRMHLKLFLQLALQAKYFDDFGGQALMKIQLIQRVK